MKSKRVFDSLPKGELWLELDKDTCVKLPSKVAKLVASRVEGAKTHTELPMYILRKYFSAETCASIQDGREGKGIEVPLELLKSPDKFERFIYETAKKIKNGEKP